MPQNFQSQTNNTSSTPKEKNLRSDTSTDSTPSPITETVPQDDGHPQGRLSLRIASHVASKPLPPVPVLDLNTNNVSNHVLSPPATPPLEQAESLSRCNSPSRQHNRALSLDSSNIGSTNSVECINLAPRHARMLPSGSSTPIPLRAPGRYSLISTHSHSSLSSATSSASSSSSSSNSSSSSHPNSVTHRKSTDVMSPISAALELLDELALSNSNDTPDYRNLEYHVDGWNLLWKNNRDMPALAGTMQGLGMSEEGEEDDGKTVISWTSMSDDSL